MKRGSRQIHKVIFVLLMIATVWMSIGLVSAIEESVDGGWNLASGSNAEETETDMTVPDETASPSDAVEEGGEIDSEATPSDATPSEATPSEAEPGTEGNGEGDTSGELEWDPIPEFEQDEHVVFEMKPLYLDANASAWDFLKGVSAHDQDGNALEVTLAEGEGNFYKASADYAEAKGLSDSADGELATLRKGRYYEVVQAWDAVDNRMNKAARIIYVGSPEDFTSDKLPEVATGSDAAMKDGELATGSNALKNVTFEMEPLYLSPTADVSAINLVQGVKAIDSEGIELPVYLVDKGSFAEAYVGPGSLTTTGTFEGQTLIEGVYYVTVGADSLDSGITTSQKRTVYVGVPINLMSAGGLLSLTYPSGNVINYNTVLEAYDDMTSRGETGAYTITFLEDYRRPDLYSEDFFGVLLKAENTLMTDVTITANDGVRFTISGQDDYVNLYRNTVFKNITLIADSSVSIYGNEYPVEMGEGIVCEGSGGISIYASWKYRYGDAVPTNLGNNVHMIIRSGTYVVVDWGSHVESNNDVSVEILGGVIEQVDGGWGGLKKTYRANVNLIGGTIGVLSVPIEGGNQSLTVNIKVTPEAVLKHISTSTQNYTAAKHNYEICGEIEGEIGGNSAVPTEICVVGDCTLDSVYANSLIIEKGATLKVRYATINSVATSPARASFDVKTLRLEGNAGIVTLADADNTGAVAGKIISVGEGNYIQHKWGSNSYVVITDSSTPITGTLTIKGDSDASGYIIRFTGITDTTKIDITAFKTDIPGNSLALNSSGGSNAYVYMSLVPYPISVQYPDGTFTGFASLLEALADVEKKGTGTCILICNKRFDMTTEEINKFNSLTGSFDKLIFRARDKSKGMFLRRIAWEGDLHCPVDVEMDGMIPRAKTTNTTANIYTDGHTLTLGELSYFSNTAKVAIVGSDGTSSASKVILNGGNVDGGIKKGTATSMEVLIQNVQDNVISSGIDGMSSTDVAGMKGIDVKIEDGYSCTIPYINGLGTLTLGKGSGLTVTDYIRWNEKAGGIIGGEGKVYFSGTSLLQLPQNSYAEIGSIVVEGEGNTLEMWPLSSTAPVRVMKAADGPGNVSGNGKLKLAPVSGAPYTIGYQLLSFEITSNAKSANYDEVFYEAGDRFVDTDGVTGLVTISGPLQNVRLSGTASTVNSSLKKIMEAIGTNTGTYKVTFLKPNYTISKEDAEAMKANGQNASQIIYTGTYTITSGDPMLSGEKIGDSVTRSINLSNDIEFPSNTVLEEMDISCGDADISIFAGGHPLTIADSVTVSSEKKPCIYGGKDGTDAAAGSLSLNGGAYQSVYGGGRNSNVTGDTSVTIAAGVAVSDSVFGGGNNGMIGKNTNVTMADNEVTGTISGGGTGEVSTVEGNRTINLSGTINTGNLMNFSSLNIGSNSKEALLTVDGGLDSDPGMAEAASSGTIFLNHGSTLSLNATGNPVQKAGYLSTDSAEGNTLLITKNVEGVHSLTINGNKSAVTAKPLVLGFTQTSMDPNVTDPILKFTNRSAVKVSQYTYKDTQYHLYVDKGIESEGILCLGLKATPNAQLVKAVHKTMAGEFTIPESGDQKVTKMLYFNLHDIDLNKTETGGGLDTESIYIDSNSAGTDQWMNDGTLPKAAVKVVIDDPKGDGANTWTGKAEVVDSAANTIYYIHVRDKMGNYTTMPIDTTAPCKSKDIQIASASGGFTVTLELSDPLKTVPTDMTYTQGNIAWIGWNMSEQDNAALEEIPDESIFNDVKQVNPTVSDYKYELKISTAQMNGNGSAVAYVYVKDSYGNTGKIQIPLSQYMLNVSVPTKVGVVAIKGGNSPKLLSPDCFVKNQGLLPIKISVKSFGPQTATASNALKMVNKDSGFLSDEMNLKLQPLDESALFGVTSLAGISESAPLLLGTLNEGGKTGSMLGFKFTADYDPLSIMELADWDQFVINYELEMAEAP